MQLLMVIGFLFCLTSLSAQASDASLEARLKALEDKFENQELESSLKKRVNFSGTFLNHFESINSQTADDAGVQTNNYGTVIGTHVALNMDFQVSSSLDFFTTLGMGKIWNNDGREGETESTYRSNQGSYGYTGSEARFDVAYARWKKKRWSFALGRMTTQGGPPMNQLDALVRAGTYPRFAYNAIFDGVAFVHHIDTSSWKDLTWVVRGFYTPYFFVDTNDRMQPAEDANNGGRIKRRSDQFALLNEFELKNRSWAKKTSVYSMLWLYNNFYDEEYQDDSNTEVEYYRATSHTLFVGLEGILGTGINLSWSNLRVSDKLTGSEGANSASNLFNLNYVFPNGHVLGLEYIKTDADFYLDDFNYMQFNDFYQRSDNEGFHYFYTYVIDPSQRIRLGVYDYRGEIALQNNWDYRERTRNVYTSYRLDF